MSQPPPWDQGQPPNQGQLPTWPTQSQPPSWPSAGPNKSQPNKSQPNKSQLPSWPSGDQPPAWPSAGQPTPPSPPPSWPSGGPNQGPPSSGPPGGQPPYPGPGYTYGYAPRPPRFRRRRRFRGTLIALGLLVVLSGVIRAVANHNAVSNTASPSASGGLATGRQAPPGKVGSWFDLKDSSGDIYRVTLVTVIDPAQGADQFSLPDTGKRFVGLVFRIKALTGSPQNEDANDDAVLVAGNGQTYPADFDDIAGYTNFDSGSIHVAQGDTVTGAVTFQVPDGVTVSKVQWSALSGFGSMVEWNVHGLVGDTGSSSRVRLPLVVRLVLGQRPRGR